MAQAVLQLPQLSVEIGWCSSQKVTGWLARVMAFENKKEVSMAFKKRMHMIQMPK